MALLDDVATLTKLAAASIDDVGAAAGRAGAKTAGVVIDDTAVTPRYVLGLAPARELPIIGKIAVGSLKNKLLILLPVALLLSAFLPVLIIPLLMIGGAYLSFEATEKILEWLLGHHQSVEEVLAVGDAQELEARQVSGAIRTDFILSAEIMAIALAELEVESFAIRAAALAAVALLVTGGVYGLVAVIVKLDDIGLRLATRGNAAVATLGRLMVKGVPRLLTVLTIVGTAAMLWVGGGIFLHGLEEMHLLEQVPHAIHAIARAAAVAIGWMPGVVEWVANAFGAAVAGFIVGGMVILGLKGWASLRPGTSPAH